MNYTMLINFNILLYFSIASSLTSWQIDNAVTLGSIRFGSLLVVATVMESSLESCVASSQHKLRITYLRERRAKTPVLILAFNLKPCVKTREPVRDDCGAITFPFPIR